MKFSKTRSQIRRRIEVGAGASVYKIQKHMAVIIGSACLQAVTKSSCKREQTDRRRRSLDQITQGEMDVDTNEHKVIDHAVENASLAGARASQPRQLAVGIVQRIGQHMKRHAGNVDRQIAIIIKMTR